MVEALISSNADRGESSIIVSSKGSGERESHFVPGQ